MLFLLFAFQAAAQADIELSATVQARSLTIEKAGAAAVNVSVNGPSGVAVHGPKANGRKRLENPVFTVKIEAWSADPSATPQLRIMTSD